MLKYPRYRYMPRVSQLVERGVEIRQGSLVRVQPRGSFMGCIAQLDRASILRELGDFCINAFTFQNLGRYLKHQDSKGR